MSAEIPQERERRPRIVACAPAYNEEHRVALSIRNAPRDLVETFLVVDDGSSDGTRQAAEAEGAVVLRHEQNRGVGAALRTGMQYAQREGYDIFVIVSGSGKTRAEEIRQILEPLLAGEADLTKGSRYLRGGQALNMPPIRRLGTRGYSFLFSLFARKWVTDASNGFRAYRLALLEDPRINLDQAWLDRYELEPYFLYKALRLGYRVREVPVTVAYPQGVPGPYTKMRAFLDWWNILAPVIWLALGIRK